MTLLINIVKRNRKYEFNLYDLNGILVLQTEADINEQTEEEINQIINRLRISDIRSGDVRKLGEKIHNILPEKVKEKIANIGKDYIIISTNIETPFELIYTNGIFLCLSNPVGKMVIANPDQLLPQNVWRSRKLSALFVANPTEDLNYVDSNGANKDAEEGVKIIIEGLKNLNIEIETLFRNEANKSNITDKLKKKHFDLFYYLGHVIYDEKEASKSILRLSDEDITAEEFLKDIKPPKLVFFNACISGVCGPETQEESIATKLTGIAGIFIEKGVRNYIGTLWPVFDWIAAEIAIDFFKELINGEKIGEALRAAKLNAFNKYGRDQPTWAAYTLFGNPENIIERIYINIPDITGFMDREEEQEKLKEIIKNENMVVIQGIAGMGKTYIAAKIANDLDMENEKVYWKNFYNPNENFISFVRDIGKFLKIYGNMDLMNYIENGGKYFDDIMELILNILKKDRYVLFFDNYNIVNDTKIESMFRAFKEQLNLSKIVITTREKPSFVTEVFRLEGFNKNATKEYLEKMEVKVTSGQLEKIDRRIGGHIESLLLFSNYAKEVGVDEALKDLVGGCTAKCLYEKIYKLLEDNEKEVLKILSIFRIPELVKACAKVAEAKDVGDTLIELEKNKLLVKRIVDRYYLHDLIKEFSYKRIDDPDEYHKRAGEYYATLKKTPENIIETIYHLIKYYGAVNDDVIEYLMDTPEDAYTQFVVLNILYENEIDSSKFFDLIKKIYVSGNLSIKKLTITTLVNNKDFNVNKIIDIIEDIIKKDENIDITYSAIYSLANLIDIIPERVLEILNNIIRDPKEKYVYAILNMLHTSMFKNDGTILILRQIVFSDSENINFQHKRVASNLLKDWGITIIDRDKISLTEFKKMTAEDAFDYVKYILSDKKRAKYIHETALTFILSNLYKTKPKASSDLMKKFIKNYVWVGWEWFSEVLANPMYYDPKIISDFLAESDWFIRYTGFMTLELNINNKFQNVPIEMHKESKEKSISILENLVNDKDPVMREMAKVAYNRVIKTKDTEKQKIGQNIKNKIKKKILNLVDINQIQKYLSADIGHTYQYGTIKQWVVFNAMIHTDPEKVFGVLRAMGKEGVIEKKITKFVFNEIKNNPCDAIDILDEFGIKSTNFLTRLGAIICIGMIGPKCPEKALEVYESVFPNIDSDLKILIVGWLQNFLDIPEGEKAKKILEKIIQDEDKEVSAFADMILNGIQFMDEK